MFITICAGNENDPCKTENSTKKRRQSRRALFSRPSPTRVKIWGDELRLAQLPSNFEFPLGKTERWNVSGNKKSLKELLFDYEEICGSENFVYVPLWQSFLDSRLGRLRLGLENELSVLNWLHEKKSVCAPVDVEMFVKDRELLILGDADNDLCLRPYRVKSACPEEEDFKTKHLIKRDQSLFRFNFYDIICLVHLCVQKENPVGFVESHLFGTLLVGKSVCQVLKSQSAEAQILNSLAKTLSAENYVGEEMTDSTIINLVKYLEVQDKKKESFCSPRLMRNLPNPHPLPDPNLLFLQSSSGVLEKYMPELKNVLIRFGIESASRNVSDALPPCEFG
jgi:hypothetical protein